jgi:acetolactate synthase-1/2/3 large subunit
VIFGIGCSFTSTNFGVTMPKGKTIIHSTLDPVDLNKNVVSQHAMVGDAALTLDALITEMKTQGQTQPDTSAVTAKIAKDKKSWLTEWMPKLTCNDAPLNPYRVLWDLANTVDRPNTIITHDAGSPRDQLSPFWEATTPLSYIGWGKTTQLGYGLGLAMGAKLACPDKLCINVWGDAAIGFTGMDFETAVRERIPILSILLNNFSMAIELKVMPVSTEKYRSTDISGDYAAMARAFGGYGERVTAPDDIIPAIQRGIEQTQSGTPVLIEFITSQEVNISTF